MKKLKVIALFMLYLLFGVDVNSQTTETPTYNIITGKIPNVLRESDLKRQFELMELEEFVIWLKPQSHEVTEGAVISEERLTNLLMGNYNMRKKVVTQDLKRYHRPLLKYMTHHYQKNWVKEWMVVSRIERNIIEEATQEMEKALDEMEGSEEEAD